MLYNMRGYDITQTVGTVRRAGGSPRAENRNHRGVIASPGFAMRSVARLSDAGNSPDSRW